MADNIPSGTDAAAAANNSPIKDISKIKAALSRTRKTPITETTLAESSNGAETTMSESSNGAETAMAESSNGAETTAGAEASKGAEASTSSSDTPADPTPAPKLTAYEKICYNIKNDPKFHQDAAYGKRIGFYRLHAEIGRGNFSLVKAGSHELTRERVAIKVLDKVKMTCKSRAMLDQEIKSMERVHHPNIIRLYEVVEMYTKIHLVMEYANNGELFHKLSTKGKLEEEEARSIFKQLVSAVKHLHDRNIIHRDIKAENVFLGARGAIKLGDFGFSRQLVGGPEDLLHTFCGSPPYAAPELFRDVSCAGGPVDVWALGVLLFFMTTGYMPFPAGSLSGLKRSILRGVIKTPAHMSAECAYLVRAILRQAPLDRLTVDQILYSTWLKDVPMKRRECEWWCMQPTLTPGAELSDIEKQTRDRIGRMGITTELLAEHAPKGCYSSVIATYRIVSHRIWFSSQLPPLPPAKPSSRSRTCIIL